jgi:hypothetical protein
MWRILRERPLHRLGVTGLHQKPEPAGTTAIRLVCPAVSDNPTVWWQKSVDRQGTSTGMPAPRAAFTWQTQEVLDEGPYICSIAQAPARFGGDPP